MEKVLLVMAVVLLSGAHAIASNAKPNQTSERNVADFTITARETSSVNITISQGNLSNLALSEDFLEPVIADAAPPDRGSPDTRGGSPPGRR